MRPADRSLAASIKNKIQSFANTVPLPGLQSMQHTDCLVEQIVDSIRRVKYVSTIAQKNNDAIYADANSIFFDPLKAALYFFSIGDINEAFWLIFLATHFGRSSRSKWTLVREVYKGQGKNNFWTWKKTTTNFPAFQTWLQSNNARIRALGTFSNHRKYTSLDAYKPVGTGTAIGSYIEWVGVHNDHMTMLLPIVNSANGDHFKAFDLLYKSMTKVISFGRIGRFDFLTMLGKMKFLDIEPGIPYMKGATGPLLGAKLLFGGQKTAKISPADADQIVVQLGKHIGGYFIMQVLEDAICNWQKNPDRYIYFNG